MANHPAPTRSLFVLGSHHENPYLDPKSLQENGPQPLKRAQKAMILHTFEFQVQKVHKDRLRTLQKELSTCIGFTRTYKKHCSVSMKFSYASHQENRVPDIVGASE